MTAAQDPDRGAARRRLGFGAVVVIVIAALAVTVGIGILRSASAPVDEVVFDDPLASSPAPSAPSAEDLYVHVSGAVTSPGLYVLAPEARVVDAIASAGGFAGDADTDAVNLARPLDDGEQLYVPREGELPSAVPPGASGAGSGSSGATGNGLVNLNTADAAALETLPRIGPALAERIIAWREENGGFTSVDDLLAVPGIGDKMLASLRDLVAV